jgi:hypothetical protein
MVGNKRRMAVSDASGTSGKTVVILMNLFWRAHGRHWPPQRVTQHQRADFYVLSSTYKRPCACVRSVSGAEAPKVGPSWRLTRALRVNTNAIRADPLVFQVIKIALRANTLFLFESTHTWPATHTCSSSEHTHALEVNAHLLFE